MSNFSRRNHVDFSAGDLLTSVPSTRTKQSEPGFSYYAHQLCNAFFLQRNYSGLKAFFLQTLFLSAKFRIKLNLKVCAHVRYLTLVLLVLKNLGEIQSYFLVICIQSLFFKRGRQSCIGTFVNVHDLVTVKQAGHRTRDIKLNLQTLSYLGNIFLINRTNQSFKRLISLTWNKNNLFYICSVTEVL